MNKEFKVGDLVRIKNDTPEDWGTNLYVVDFVSNTGVIRMKQVDRCYTVWYAKSDIEHFIDDRIIRETADKIMTAETKEVEELLMNNDKELRTKAELYDKICDKLFMATGIIEDGDSIQYIIDPEIIINEIIKIITEIPLSRETQREKKRTFVRSIRGTDW